MNHRFLLILLAIITMVGVSCNTSKVDNDRIAERIDSLLNSNYTDDAPGCAMAILKDDKVVYMGCRGIADVNTKEKINEHTVFNIASITKQFTALAILSLFEQGKLDINDSVAMYFPEFKSDIWKTVKLKHLMSHSSGVPDNRPRVDKDFMLHIVDKQCLEYMVDLDELKFEPGTKYDYKNPTFQVLAEVVKRVSGTDFETFQKENIFNKAGMTNVRYFEPTIEIPHMAHGYINISESDLNSIDSDSEKEKGDLETQYTDKNGRHWMEYDYGEETFFGTKADGGIYTSLDDFIKWEIALSNDKVVAKSTKDLAYTPHIEVSGSKYSSYQNRDNTYYGYGWFIDKKPNRETKIYHTGDNGGFQAYAAKYPKSNVCVMMFSNRNDLDRWSTQMEIEQIIIEEELLSND